MKQSSTHATVPRRPKVAVILSGYGLVDRGAEIMLEQLLPGLAERFELHVYSRSGQGPGGVRSPAIPRRFLSGGYTRWRWLRKILDTLFLDPLHVEWTSHLLTALPRLLAGRYDVVWHETGLWGGLIMRFVRRLTGARILDIAHSSHTGWEVPFARQKPDAYVVSTEAFGSLMRKRMPRLPIEIIPQGVDCATFSPRDDPWPLDVEGPVVLAVGALSAEKRPLLLIEAVSLTECSLVLAGDGPLAGDLDAAAARSLPHCRYQRLTLARRDMPRLYAAAEVVALASPFEALSFALLEALACNKPVVSVDDAVRREVVGDAGILVEGSQPARWARALSAAVGRDWDLAPRRQAHAFDLEVTVSGFSRLLTDLSERRS